MKHGYNVGQIVELKPNVMRIAAAGPYEITRLMPEPDVNSESPRYRIKSREEIRQRIVPESDLLLPTAPTSRPAVDTPREALLAASGVAVPPIEE